MGNEPTHFKEKRMNHFSVVYNKSAEYLKSGNFNKVLVLQMVALLAQMRGGSLENNK